MTGLANEQVVQITTQFTWRDGLEIGVVALVFYRILLLIHGTRALQILGGVAVLVAAYAIASLLQLTMITYLLGLVFTYGVFALLIIFQPELRAALAHLGQAPVTRLFKRVEQGPVEDDIADAVDRLSRSGVGAIIAIERDVPLSDFIDSGSSLQAKVSADLLTTIFTPYSPLHDGAVIIRGDTIVGAGCILPLSQGAVGHRSLGTRHRAALGLAEETDAIVIVVSEETAVVSVARDGALQVRLTPVQLRDLLAGRAVKSTG
ncbi:diadenylate cyclase CdaA [Gemmatimonas sp.]|uniref:diadenylate cyclase CdaA n=1 Tax=Gemmatimonas sp. TaxID=1962908 RepID=UPI00286E6BEE|nr:diadenylate cyclase CdaA [Gemmatimonas sp.]